MRKTFFSLFVIPVACCLLSVGASGQLLLKKVINKKKTTVERQGLLEAKDLKKTASLAEDANTNPSNVGQGGADFTVPDLGQSVHIIPTPTFNYTNTKNGRDWGFQALLWGNSLGVDSDMQKAASNLLVPEVSLLGMKFEYSRLFPWFKGDFQLGMDADFNLLVKKVAYFDKETSVSTNFNPFVFHPRVGLTGSLFQVLFVSAYCNVMTALSDNEQFTTFFKTNGKSSFIYPEADVAAIVNIDNTGKQQLKFSFNVIVNNGELQTLTNSADKVIPYVKASFVTNL